MGDHMLPVLFRQRAKAKSKAPIEGCAVTRDRTDLTPGDTCACAAGKESEGCVGVPADSDYILLCKHLRQRVLPRDPLERLFSEGGFCSVDSNTPFNRPLVLPGLPRDFNAPSSAELRPAGPR